MDGRDMNAVFTNFSRFFGRLSVRQIFSALAVSPLGILGAGVILGELVHLKVCYLCNFQRFMYLVMAFFALWGVLLPRAYRLFGGLYALTALVGAGTAIYQSWMQFAPDTVAECGFGDPTLIERTVDWLSLQWPTLFMVTGLCAEKDWIFLGLTLANWSTLVFLSFFAALFWLLLCYRPKNA
ncbi:MAG: disulfide bond formation protein B [Candidatus Accumulibacter sp.]|jgi:disulfide bond formation protein DsbB|nr:disulfide bond formation protein B [Accumulibacter sp.]